MSIKVEYSGHFYNDLPKLLMERDGFSLGEKLAQIEKTARKKYVEMTDEEVYTSLKTLIETKEYYLDEIPDETFWTEFLK